MKLFMRLLLERVRAVMLLRNAPGQAEEILGRFSEADAEQLKAIAEEATSPINSHLLVKLLTATEQASRVPLPQVPLEIAIIESLQK